MFIQKFMINKIIFSGKQFVYNVGNQQEEINALNLAKKIFKVSENTKVNIKKVKYPNSYQSDETKRRRPSIERYKSDLTYRRKINLQSGLK